jgi:hypothetical protein
MNIQRMAFLFQILLADRIDKPLFIKKSVDGLHKLCFIHAILRT